VSPGRGSDGQPAGCLPGGVPVVTGTPLAGVGRRRPGAACRRGRQPARRSDRRQRHAHQHRGAHDQPTDGSEPGRHGLRAVAPLVVLLPHSGYQEHLVVPGESEVQREQHDRHVGFDVARGIEAEQAVEMAVLEDSRPGPRRSRSATASSSRSPSAAAAPGRTRGAAPKPCGTAAPRQARRQRWAERFISTTCSSVGSGERAAKRSGMLSRMRVFLTRSATARAGPSSSRVSSVQ
jgi:hypothetical protein